MTYIKLFQPTDFTSNDSGLSLTSGRGVEVDVTKSRSTITGLDISLNGNPYARVLNLSISQRDLRSMEGKSSLADLGILDGNDSIYGSEGNDVLTGLDGNDFIAGSDGNDVLIGGLGQDSLHGGRGSNYYADERDNSWDWITLTPDYDFGQSLDVIEGLDASDWIYMPHVRPEDLSIQQLDAGVGIFVSGSLEAVYVGGDLSVDQMRQMTIAYV